MKANLNYFYKNHQKNVKKLYFFSKIAVLTHQKAKMKAVKN